MLSYAVEVVDSLIPKSIKSFLKRILPGLDKKIYRLVWRVTPDTPRRCQIRRGVLKGRPFECSLKRERDYWLGIWEPEIEQFLVREVAVASTVFDIGVHKGYFSLIAAQLAGPSGRVVGFEPNPGNYRCALQNIALNEDLAPRITLTPYAIADKAGVMEFFGGSGSTMGGIVRHATDRTTYQVETISLDEFCQTAAIRPSVIKMDIEGGEQWAIRGMAFVLAEFRPVMLIEVHDCDAFQAVDECCGMHSYRLETLKTQTHPGDTNWGEPVHYVARPE